MTQLTKPVRRETAATTTGRSLIVELHPGYMTLREKGRRFKVSVGAVLHLAYKQLAAQKLAEKKGKKGGRR